MKAPGLRAAARYSALIGVVVLAGPAAAAELWITSVAPCAPAADVARALSPDVSRRVRLGVPAAGALTLAISRRGDEVDVALGPAGAAPAMRRVLHPLPQDCAALPQAVALLAQSWLRQGLAAPVPPPPPAASPRPPPPARAPPRAAPLSPAPPGAAPLSSAPPGAAPLSSAPPGAAPPPSPSPSVDSKAPPPPGPRAALELALGPQVDLGDASVVARGALRALGRVTPRLWVGGGFAMTTVRRVPVAGGSAQLFSARLALRARLALHASPSGLALEAGPALELVEAWTQRVPGGRHRRVLDPALDVGVLWHQALGRRAFVAVGLAAHLRAVRETFSIEGAGQVLARSPVALEPWAGAGWQFF